LRRALRAPGAGVFLISDWLLALLAYLRPGICPWAAVVLLILAAGLALGRPDRERLVRTAAGMWLYFATLALYMVLLGLASPIRPDQLAVWFCLGLLVVLLWTPLELGRAWLRLSRPVLGQGPALKTSLALVVVHKSLLGLLDDAGRVRRSLDMRGRGLGWRARATLFGRTMLRLADVRSEELARALLGRKL
jgi:hypothetical protein